MKTQTPDVDLSKMEHEVLAFWEKNQTFDKSNAQRRGCKEYTFYDGPPFANGLPHYGHMLGQTLKDIVPRYWNMRGYYVERRFGWDCHGLPVEFGIEKALKLNGRKDILNLGVEKFNEECRKSVFHYAHEWKRTITRLGRWVDWNNQYRTMDVSFMESVWWVFKQLHEKDLVYRDLKVVAYSPRITAVVSNFEANLNYKDVQDPSVFIKFKLRTEDAFLLAWTTTPWTLISNLALAVNPNFTYVKIKDHQTDQVYYLAQDRLEHLYKPNKDKTLAYDILQTVKGSDLLNKAYEPLFPYFANQKNAFVVLPGDFVTLDAGTGIVHMAPAFGEDDFQLCRKFHIEPVDPLDEEAHYTNVIPEFAGQYVKDADKNIIRVLKEKGKLFKQDVLVHSYPHCDRTEQPLIYRAIPTWYVAVEKIKSRLVENNQKINWVPNHLRDGRMGQWLENARDWAISRNRFWGTPLPIWVSDKDDSVMEVIGSIEELEQKSGYKATDLHKHFIDDLTWPCKRTGGTMRRVPEVFDCWFESGSMPYAQNHFPFENAEKFKANFPADFIAEGQDQTRGWFYTLAILSAALFDVPAFKNVVVNGTVLAADGKKMSKRLQNYTAPELLLEQFGSDSVRLYMVNSAVLRGDDLKFSDEGVRDTTRAVILPLWNAFSFLTTYANADGWQPSAEFAQGKVPTSTDEMDRWIISRLQSVKARVHEQMELYTIYNVVPQILGFIDELTNWYIRLNRRRFWGESGKLSENQCAAYETLYYVMLEFIKIFAPFAPFVSEKIYQSLTDGIASAKDSVHLCDMPMTDNKLIDSDLEARMDLVRRATLLGRSLRAKHQIRTRQVLPSMLIITRKAEHKAYIEKGSYLIKEELNLKDVSFSTDEATFVRLSVKPNLKTLGKRLGKDLGAFRQHLEMLNQEHEKVAGLLAELDEKGSVLLLGQSVSADDFLVERGPKDHRLIATESGITVLLDTTLTEELILEGLSREIINRVQKLRKDSGLNVSDRINLYVVAEGPLADALNRHKTYVGSETLAVSIQVANQNDHLGKAQHKGDFDIEGVPCSLGITVNNNA